MKTSQLDQLKELRTEKKKNDFSIFFFNLDHMFSVYLEVTEEGKGVFKVVQY